VPHPPHDQAHPPAADSGLGCTWFGIGSKPHFHVRLTHLLPKKITVNLLIAVFKEKLAFDDCRAASRGAGDRIPPRAPNAS
jgi:hypothetical protein